MSRFAFSFGIILFGLSSGYAIQQLHRHHRIRLPIPIDSLRKLLQQIALLFLNPVAIVGAVWAVKLKDPELMALPFIGLFALVAGGLLALAAARILHLEPRKTGAIFGCGSFTNIGSIGALVCFVFLGEAGFALVPIYKLFEEISYYSIGFPIAKYFSGAESGDIRLADRLKRFTRDPFILVALTSIIAGALLNAGGFHRPEGYAGVIAIFVPLATVLLLASIGLALRFSRVGNYLRECLSVSFIKFLLVPSAATTLAYFLGLGGIDEALPLKVVLILSSMPVAFNALIPPSLYDLDIDLANSCWLVTTALLGIVLPLLLTVIQLF